MKRLYINLTNQTTTNIETFETLSYSSQEDLFNIIMDRREAATIYVYDLSYYWRYFTKLFINNGMVCKDFIGTGEGLDKNTFTVVSSFRETAVVKIQAKGNQVKNHTTNILDAKNLLGGTEIEDIMKSTQTDDENEAIAFFLGYMLEQGHTKGTLSANAFSSLVKFMYPKSEKPDLSFGSDFSINEEVDCFCRRSYHGGFCWLRPEYKNSHIEATGVTYDVNSLFPAVMEQEWLPTGAGVRFEGKYAEDRKMPLYFQEVMIFNLRLKEGGIPCLKQETTNSAYFEADMVYPFVSLVLNHVDLGLMEENYEYDMIEYLGGYKFVAKKKMFKGFINYWKAEKIAARNEGDKLREKVAKLMLNSAYGKFGSKIERVPVNISVLKSGVIAKLPNLEADNKGKMYYVPLASYITSYGKKRLVDAIKANYERVVYVDTDSIHLIGAEEAKDIVIDNNEFGAWKLERTWTEGKFLGLKKYAEFDGNWTVKCAGLPADIIEEVEKDIELFQLGTEFNYESEIVNHKGEVEVVSSIFTLEEQSLERI